MKAGPTLKQNRLIVLSSLLLLSLLFVGCGKEGSTVTSDSAHSRWSSFPIDLYADPFLLSDSEANDDLSNAINYWHEKAGRTIFNFRGAWSGPAYSGDPESPDEIFANVIFFEGPWPFESNVAGKTVLLSEANRIQSSMILLNPDTSVCSGDCVGKRSYTSRRKLLAHELGHMIGMVHVEDTQNIMNPSITPGGSLTNETVDTEELQYLTD